MLVQIQSNAKRYESKKKLQNRKVFEALTVG